MSKPIQINPYHKSKELLDLNPRGLVPTLQYDNKPLYESTVICEFLEETYHSHGPKLLPRDSFDKARARIWIDFVGSRVIPSFFRFLQYSDDTDQGLQAAREDFHHQLKQFTQAMDETGPFFLGSEISLVDIAIIPWAVRLWVFDHFKGGLKLPKEGSDAETWSRFDKWLDAVKAVPSVKATTSETEHYLPIYKRYADNVAQSEMAKATRAGRGVP